MGSFFVVLNSVVTLFLMMAVGFFFARKGWLTKDASSQLSRLLLYVVTPCIILDLFLVERDPATDMQLLVSGGSLAAMYLACIILAPLLFRGQPEGDRGVLRFASIYGNVGFMGLPLIRATLGDGAGMTAALGIGVFNLFCWTHGMAVIGGRDKISLKKAVINPAVLAFAAAILFYLTGWRLPGPISAAVGHMASMNTPLAMVVIGGQMAGTDLASLLGDRRMYAASAFKSIVMPVLTMLMLLPFRVDPVTYTALAILAGCPSGGNTSLFSQMLGRDTDLAARQVTLSTLLSIITLPLTALAAQTLIGYF